MEIKYEVDDGVMEGSAKVVLTPNDAEKIEIIAVNFYRRGLGFMETYDYCKLNHSFIYINMIN